MDNSIIVISQEARDKLTYKNINIGGAFRRMPAAAKQTEPVRQAEANFAPAKSHPAVMISDMTPPCHKEERLYPIIDSTVESERQI